MNNKQEGYVFELDICTDDEPAKQGRISSTRRASSIYHGKVALHRWIKELLIAHDFPVGRYFACITICSAETKEYVDIDEFYFEYDGDDVWIELD